MHTQKKGLGASAGMEAFTSNSTLRTKSPNTWRPLGITSKPTMPVVCFRLEKQAERRKKLIVTAQQRLDERVGDSFAYLFFLSNLHRLVVVWHRQTVTSRKIEPTHRGFNNQSFLQTGRVPFISITNLRPAGPREQAGLGIPAPS